MQKKLAAQEREAADLRKALALSKLQQTEKQPAARGKVGYVCARDRCFQSLHASPSTNGSSCEQTKPPSEKCSPLKPAEWLALKQHW